MENFTAIRNGLREHISAGRISPFDLGIFTFLQLSVDWGTGIYHGCAQTIAYQFGDPTLKQHIQKSLRRLRDRKYINYKPGDGTRGGYPILIHKYEPTVGELLGTRLNAWKHGQLAQPEYEPKNGHGTVAAQSWHSGGTVVAPIQDLQDLKKEEKEPGAVSVLKEGKLKEVWDYYLEQTGRNELLYSFTIQKRKMGAGRFLESLAKTQGDPDKAAELMKCAIDALMASKFHAGQNEEKTDYRNWELVFKDQDTFEGWLQRSER